MLRKTVNEQSCKIRNGKGGKRMKANGSFINEN